METNKLVCETHRDAVRWHINGVFHREDGPAIIYNSGTKRWYINGNLHREDGPAIEFTHGSEEWYLNGKLHRVDGPAIKNIFQKEWWFNGKRHREDGPAIERSDDSYVWFIHGVRHRLNGPTSEIPDGYKTWYVDGMLLDRHPLSKWLKKRRWYSKFKRGDLTECQVLEIKMVFNFH